MDAEPDATPDRCVLAHQVFTRFGDVTFRRAEADGTPVMIIQLGEREAAVPLRALQREFDIGDETADGRMLGLIAESLDYVSGLHLGDLLPAEVLTGRASWEPEPRHRRIAEARLKNHLVAWIFPDSPARNDTRLDEDPALRQQVHAAFEQAAGTLGLPSAADVISKLQELAHELAYIEALRDGLLRRVQAMVGRVHRFGRGLRGDSARATTLTQVQRLAAIALDSMAVRFDEVDAQTGEVMSALRNIESQQSFIRSNRDPLYRSLRAWDPLLREWDELEEDPDDGMWGLVNRSYQFLAPRYMPTQEWLSPQGARPRPKKKLAAMTW
jgi:hypothetical protein